MLIFKKAIEERKNKAENEYLMDKESEVYYCRMDSEYFVFIAYRNMPKGYMPDFYIEFENEQQAKIFCGKKLYNYSRNGIKLNGNKIDILYMEGEELSQIVKCGYNKELAKHLVKLFRKQYEEYKANRNVLAEQKAYRAKAEQEEEIKGLGIKF